MGIRQRGRNNTEPPVSLSRCAAQLPERRLPCRGGLSLRVLPPRQDELLLRRRAHPDQPAVQKVHGQRMSARARAGAAPPGAAALCGVVLLLTLLSGCGNGDSTTTSAETASGETTTSTAGETTTSTASGESKGGEYKGGEASIEEFGEEAGGTDRAAILGAFKGQLAAIGRKDFAATCSHLSKQAQEGLAELGKSV